MEYTVGEGEKKCSKKVSGGGLWSMVGPDQSRFVVGGDGGTANSSLDSE